MRDRGDDIGSTWSALYESRGSAIKDFATDGYIPRDWTTRASRSERAAARGANAPAMQFRRYAIVALPALIPTVSFCTCVRACEFCACIATRIPLDFSGVKMEKNSFSGKHLFLLLDENGEIADILRTFEWNEIVSELLKHSKEEKEI